MKRMAPPARVRVETAAAPAFARIERADGAIRLTAATPPAGATVLEAAPIALMHASPVAVEHLEACASGRILLGLSPGIARTFAMPDVAPMFDRRPVGIDAIVGAASANAGLLHADDGWRAVVLPSLGDRIADLGPGPVAIRADGLRVFAASSGAIAEIQLADSGEVARHDGDADLIAVRSDGTPLTSVGGAVGPAGAATGTGETVVQLAAAADADVAVARRADETISIYAGTALRAEWASPIGPLTGLSVSPDGAWVVLRTVAGSAVARSSDGALSTYIVGAPALCLLPNGRLAVGGEWGTALITPTQEETA
jgi:hypothetical protein